MSDRNGPAGPLGNDPASNTTSDTDIVPLPCDMTAFRAAISKTADVPPPGKPLEVAKALLDGKGGCTIFNLHYWRETWFLWIGTHWTEVDDGDMRSWIQSRLERATYQKRVRVKCATKETEAEYVYEETAWAPNTAKVTDVYNTLRNMVRLNAKVEMPSWIGDTRHEGDVYISCANGLLEVSTRKLLNHTHEYFNGISVPFDYDKRAPKPKRWLSFLDSLWPQDTESKAFLREWMGYVLSGRRDLHKIAFLLGPKRCGKGTIARLIEKLIGKGNVAWPAMSAFSSNFGLANLIGKPLAIVGDVRIEERNAPATERLLTISGGDGASVPRKFKSDWEGYLPTRFMMLSNLTPVFEDRSGTIVDRFIILVMTKSWFDEEDPKLESDLAKELPGILNWALDGLDRIAAPGQRFTVPTVSVPTATIMRESASPVLAFIADCCEIGEGEGFTPVKDMYGEWGRWCIANGRDRPGSIQQLSRSMHALGIVTTQPRTGDGGRLRVFQDIRIARPVLRGDGSSQTTSTYEPRVDPERWRQGEVDSDA